MLLLYLYLYWSILVKEKAAERVQVWETWSLVWTQSLQADPSQWLGQERRVSHRNSKEASYLLIFNHFFCCFWHKTVSHILRSWVETKSYPQKRWLDWCLVTTYVYTVITSLKIWYALFRCIVFCCVHKNLYLRYAYCSSLISGKRRYFSWVKMYYTLAGCAELS